MPKRILRIKRENTWGQRHEQWQFFDIVINKKGQYFSKVTKWNEQNKKGVRKKELDAQKIEGLLSKLFKIQLPAFPKHNMGCDGGFTEIEFGGYEGKSSFRWWSAPPKGWEELDNITRKLTDICIE